MSDLHHIATSPAGDYPLRGSYYLAGILCLGHCSVAALLWWLDLAPVLRASAWLILLGSLFYELRLALRLGGNAVTALRIETDGVLRLHTARRGWVAGELLGSSYVTSFLSVINLRVADERRMRSVVLLPDSIGRDEYRRLRVWLRWRPPVSAVGS